MPKEKRSSSVVNTLSPIRSPLQQDIIDPRLAKDDNELLAEIGYKPELKRYFSTLQVFGVAFSIMGLLPSISSVMAIGLTGGTVGLVWGWFIASIFILLVGITMSELGSAIPTSGGLYYWTYHYAPESLKIPLSFLIGNSNTLALTGGLCSINYGFASEVLAAVAITYDGDFEITTARTYGVFAACVVSHIIVCCGASSKISRLQTFSIVCNVSLIILFLVALPIGTAKNTSGFRDAKFIFGKFENLSDWPDGWQFMLSLMPAVWTIGGFDSVIHCSEEATNASKSVPIGIIGAIASCGILGWVIIIMICACINEDIESVLNSPFGVPIAQIIYEALGKKWAIAFMALIAYCQWLMGASILVAISRQVWAFSRDNGLPFSSFIKVVYIKWSVPIRSVCFAGCLGIVVGLLCLIGSQAANALFTLAVSANYLSWGTPVFLRFVFGKDIFKPGPFYLGKTLSPIINWIALAWVAFIIVLCMFPASKSVEKETMNYTVVITCGIWISSMVYYYAYAHKNYFGPRKTINEIDDSSKEDINDLKDLGMTSVNAA
ncbi:Uga4p [Ascoidea rubescens DSM 1968]|uniref:Gamma-aminobutyric acid transporter n=1 Tax=Ascoidea rubescens DSM 1968 TaxID=1344418 RepID=A0A1D2VNT3_9ASCO|nr:gamma-aminobutyric acid transporter [Ascoidea rubescens DSM 1968]ODV63268.1 gamma-aminobutyric acid transporter [Ascoidea rubescens DSM 1968]